MFFLKKLLKKNPITNIFNIPLKYSFFFFFFPLNPFFFTEKNNGNKQTWLQHSDPAPSGCQWYITVDESGTDKKKLADMESVAYSWYYKTCCKHIWRCVKSKSRCRYLKWHTDPERDNEAHRNQYSTVLCESNKKAFPVVPSISTKPGPNSDLIAYDLWLYPQTPPLKLPFHHY